MRAYLLSCLLFVYLVSPLVVASADTDFAVIQVTMSAIQVSEHAWYVKGLDGMATENEGFISNAGFVVTEDGVVVFERKDKKRQQVSIIPAA